MRSVLGRYDAAPMRISRKLAALGALFVLAAAVVAGCGSSSSVGGNTVASMAGNKISLKSYKHWSYVSVKQSAAEEAAQGEQVPVIVASDPPNFTSCIKQARAQVASLTSTSDKAVKSDCEKLFAQDNTQAMSLLVEAAWIQAEAAKRGITVTQKELNKVLAAQKKAEYPTAAEQKEYLSETGETDADIRFLARVNTLYSKLAKPYSKKVTAADISAFYKQHSSDFNTKKTHESLKQASAAIKSDLTEQNEETAGTKLGKQMQKAWAKQTTCAKTYATATYCGNYKAPKTKTKTTAAATTSSSAPAASTSTPAPTTTSK